MKNNGYKFSWPQKKNGPIMSPETTRPTATVPAVPSQLRNLGCGGIQAISAGKRRIRPGRPPSCLGFGLQFGKSDGKARRAGIFIEWRFQNT